VSSLLSIDPSAQTERENYKFLTGSIIPRPIAFVTTQSSNGIVNAAPFSYFNIVSANPPMISISVQRKSGEMKDTARNIMEKKEFVIHIVDEDNVEQVNMTAANLPADESEIEVAKLMLTESEKISVPGVKEAKIRFECILEQAISLGEGEETSTDLLIGKVVQYHIEDQLYDKGRIDPHGLKAVSRLAGNDYAKLGKTFTIARPE
jgi:flavin reductase (DIM6/NTAB) family NADH-FMN oxidoreductase RutF